VLSKFTALSQVSVDLLGGNSNDDSGTETVRIHVAKSRSKGIDIGSNHAQILHGVNVQRSLY